VVNLLNPAVIIFGGPLFQSGSTSVLEAIQRVVRQRALEKAANEVKLMVSTLGPEAPALGAARYSAASAISRTASRKPSLRSRADTALLSTPNHA